MATLRNVRDPFGVALLVAVSAVLARSAVAASPLARARLSWVRAEGASACPPAHAVRDGVVKRLGWDPFTDDAPRSFEVVAKRIGSSWQANIYSHDAQRGTSGFRQIVSETGDCGELVDAVGLALALAIDPEGALAAPATPQRSSTIAAPDTTHGPIAPCPTPPPRWHSTLGVRGVAALGALPRWAAGAAFAATVRAPSRIAFSAGAMLFPSVRTEPNAPIFGFGLTAGWFDGCFVLHDGASTLVRACGGVRLGALHAVVYAPIPTEPGDRFWWALGASLAAEQQLVGPVFVEAGAEAMAPLTRHRFRVENYDAAVFEQSRIIGAGFVGIGFRVD